MIYAESVSGAALIFMVCLNLVHILQFHFRNSFRPTFPSPLQQNFEVVAGLFFFFFWISLKVEFLHIDIPGMILQLILFWESERDAMATLLSEQQ